MPVVSLVLELRLRGCSTPRQRRALVQAILGKLRRHFNVAGADVGPEDRPGEAVVGFASVGRTRREARDLLDRVAEAVAAHPSAEVARAAFDEL